MSVENKYCVYFHTNPIKQEVFYVGIGKGKRPYTKDSRNKFWHNIVNKYGYFVSVIEKELTLEEAVAREKHYIQLFGRRDLGLGTLVNMTDGGEGNNNIAFSDKTRKIWSEQRKGNKNPNYGNKLSEEHKEKMRIAKIGHPSPRQGMRHSEESKQRMSESKKGTPAWNKGIPRTEEDRKRIWLGRWGKIKTNTSSLCQQ